MANKANKIVYGSQVLIDLTQDTVTEATLLSGQTAHDKSGEIITGTCTYDSDTSDADATASELLSGKTAYARGAKITGSMVNNGKYEADLVSRDAGVAIPTGFHDGSGSIGLSTVDKAKLVAENIREGVTILGIEGTMSGSEDEKPQDNKDVTPAITLQIVTPDTDFTCLRQVTVAAIPYVEAPNAAGGNTVTIG